MSCSGHKKQNVQIFRLEKAYRQKGIRSYLANLHVCLNDRQAWIKVGQKGFSGTLSFMAVDHEFLYFVKNGLNGIMPFMFVLWKGTYMKPKGLIVP